MADVLTNREKRRRYREAHPERARESDQRYRQAHPELQRQYHEANRERRLEQQRQGREQLRATVFRRYGEVCACCGSTERLTIDHINGGGLKHRKSIGIKSAGLPFYRWLLLQYLPPGYQTLCFPCNQAKHEGNRCWLNHSPGAPSYADQRRAKDAAKHRRYREAARV